jgi:uncharacterized protein (DUF362 family)
VKLHPLLLDPRAVLVLRTPPAGPLTWDHYRRAAEAVLRALRVELEGEKVAIKPNVTSGERFADPDSGITTHPGFVHGLVDYLARQGTPPHRVTVVEDPRNTDDNRPRHWAGTGYDRLARETGARLRCPTTCTCVRKTVPRPQAHSDLSVNRLAAAPGTVLLNVPKMKTHNLAITTLGMKNLMGLVNVFDRHYCLQAWEELPEAVRAERRPRREWFTGEMHAAWQLGLARRLVDTAQVLTPALTIVEGIVAREGTGFQRGMNHPLGLVVAGTNLVAVDSLASYLMGFDPRELAYLRLAAACGLGENAVERLRVYTAVGGELLPCPDPACLRAGPPLRVIRNVKDEPPVVFGEGALPGLDPTEHFFGRSPGDSVR